jgi:hypothetical protein
VCAWLGQASWACRGLGARDAGAGRVMMADMFERLADEAARLSKASGRATLSSREVAERRQAGAPRAAGQARHVRGHQGHLQVHVRRRVVAS